MMNHIYTAYIREINDQTHYFIKQYISLPGYKQVPLILESLGMHQDFMKACELAGVTNSETIENLMKELGLNRVGDEAIPVHQLPKTQPVSRVPPLFRSAQSLLQKLKLANI